MAVHADKTSETKTRPAALAKKEGESRFTDNRPEAVLLRKHREMTGRSEQVSRLSGLVQMANSRPGAVWQRKAAPAGGPPAGNPAPGRSENHTGLPDRLKAGLEQLSGFSMNDVKVHYGSGKPAGLQAHAYAQGTDIHLGPGQERHLPHEAWHVVQQKQGRVRPTIRLKAFNINDDEGLEKEADTMGARAAGGAPPTVQAQTAPPPAGGFRWNGTAPPVQRMTTADLAVDKDGKPIEPGQKFFIPEGDAVSGIRYVEATFLGRQGGRLMGLFLFKVEGEQGTRAVVAGSEIKAADYSEKPNGEGESYFKETGVATERAKQVYEALKAAYSDTASVPKDTLLTYVKGECADLTDSQIQQAVLFLRKCGALFPAFPGPNLKAVKNFSLDASFTDDEVGGKKVADKKLTDYIQTVISRENIAGHNIHDKVRNALVEVIKSDPDDDTWKGYRRELIALFKIETAAKYYTDTYVRAGDEHEQLITSMTADQVLYDLEHPTQVAETVSGDKLTSLDYQRLTNVATQYIVLKSLTRHDSDGKKYSQNHHPTSKTLIAFVDSEDDEKLHGSPGSGAGSSPDYHHRLAEKIGSAQNLMQLNLELAQVNIDNLAGRFDILKIPASQRVNQLYVQTDGTELRFNNERQLHQIARNVEVRRRKVLGLFKIVHEMLENSAFFYPDTLPIGAKSPKAMSDLPGTPEQYNRDDDSD